MFAIASAFCWFRSAVAANKKQGIGEKLAYPIDSYLEKIPASTWNWMAAVLTCFTALLQGVSELLSVFYPTLK
jgi:hypothetical protein